MRSSRCLLRVIALLISINAITANSSPSKTFTNTKDLANALIAAKSAEERDLLLKSNHSLIGVDLRNALISEGDRLKQISNYPEAQNIYELVLKIAADSNDQQGLALANSGIGGIHFWQSNYPEALEFFEKTIAIYKQLDDKDGIAQTEKRMGFVRYYMADYQHADELLNSALHQFELSNDQAAIASTLNGMGLVYEAEGDGESAERVYKQSMKISESLNDQENVAAARNNLGNLYYDWGDFSTALNYYQKGLRFDEVQGRKWGISADLANIGGVHLSQGNYDLAIRYFQQSLAIRKSLQDQDRIANSYINIGEAYWSQNKYELALQSLNRSRTIYEKLGLKEGLAIVTQEMSQVKASQKNYSEAIELEKRALSIFEELGQLPRVAEATNILAGHYYKLRNFEEAIHYAQRSSEIAQEKKLYDTLWLAQTHAGLAYMSSGKMEEASREFQSAIDTIETLRTKVAGSERDQQIFLQERIQPYYKMIEMLQQQKKDDEALAFAERAKARVLMDVLQTGRTNITKAMTDEERHQEQQLKNNLASLNLQLTNELQNESPNSKKVSDLQNQLQKVRLDFEGFQTTLYTAHPELKIHRGEIVDRKFQHGASKFIADNKTAFLEYVVSEEKSFLFLLCSSGLKTYEIKISQQELTKTVIAYRNQIAKRNPAFLNIAKQLYNLLLSPVIPQLREIQSVIIIPDGILWELPFQALMSEKDRFFLEDVAVSYAPSMNALIEMAKIKNKNFSKQTVLAFANPAFGKETTEKVQMVFRGIQLHALPDAELEIKKLKELYGPNQTSIYFGNDATESALKKQIGNHEIIHLATHGILNETNPMYSHLLFSRTGDNDPEDGFLEAWEIMKMKLKANLVILSACETARGKIGAGEGMIGLNWAFFVAGCPTTLVSQWKVESKSTADLMFRFHQNMKNGFLRPQALQQAALAIMKNPDYRHPFYWASFILVGDPS